MKIIAIAATSLNGFITRGNEPGTAFTSEADKAWFAQTLESFPIRIMGRKTFEASQEFILKHMGDAPEIIRYVLTKSPEAFKKLSQPGQLEFTDATVNHLVESIQNAKGPNPQIAILGGGEIYAAFLKARLLNEFWITLEPQLFGFGQPLISGDLEIKLELIECQNLSTGTLLLKYRC
jgi:dihydrofolate reductase